ncbi:heme exporter protein CcmB [Alteromonas sp. 5E99-2]|uniref:heme exporter protein CcmB n=1 Tax=Alteromonas sp. 5E99-2 TaxID=2817683 RepID=UPI001F6238FB|nr:heme exporter protein CcmB [Alteromonas sp. 5E99-2]
MNLVNRVYQGVIVREFILAIRQRGEVLQPLLFILMVVTLFPIAISPSPELLSRIGPGVIWIAAILSTLLSLERIFRDDFIDGSLDQMLLCGIPLSLITFGKVFCHWLITFVPLLIMTPIFALLFNVGGHSMLVLLLTLLLGTPVLSMLGAIGVALTLKAKNAVLILSLLLVPVFIPLLIFATAAIENASAQLPYLQQLAIMGSILLFTSAIAPFAIAYALKVSQD